MSVSERDVLHVASLAALSVPPARLGELVRELNTILEHIEALRSAPTEGVEPMSAPAGATQLTRADAPPPALDGSAVSLHAPARRDGFFLVPRLDAHEDA